MTKLYRSALLPYSAEVMYDIVNRVERYQEFLPWCGESSVLSETEDSMKAKILMQKGKLNHSFTTLNTLQKNKRISLTLVDGPFKELSGDWVFTDLGETGSKIELKLEFSFSNSLVGMLVKPIFTQIANSLVDSFCERAHQLCRTKQ